MPEINKDKIIQSLTNKITLLVVLIIALAGGIVYLLFYQPLPGDGNIDGVVSDSVPGITINPASDSLFEKKYALSIDMERGEKLFRQNCSTCHRLDDKKLTGPGFKGVFQRVPSEEWMYQFIVNSDSVIKSGDAYAMKVYKEQGGLPMTVFKHLKREEIIHIMAFIHSRN